MLIGFGQFPGYPQRIVCAMAKTTIADKRTIFVKLRNAADGNPDGLLSLPMKFEDMIVKWQTLRNARPMGPIGFAIVPGTAQHVEPRLADKLLRINFSGTPEAVRKARQAQLAIGFPEPIRFQRNQGRLNVQVEWAIFPLDFPAAEKHLSVRLLIRILTVFLRFQEACPVRFFPHWGHNRNQGLTIY